MSHHLSGLGLHLLSMDARSHLTDLYAFQKPGDRNKTALIMNVNPLSPITEDAVDHQSVYEIRIDTNGDARAEIAFRVRFSPVANGAQTATVRWAMGADVSGDAHRGQIIVQDAPVSFGPSPQVTISGDYRFFAGMRSDPFFADAEGAKQGFKWTGRDTFIDKNVFGVVLEVPNRALGPNPQVGVWARVLVPHQGGLVQGDRLGRPAIDFAFNQNQEDKRTFNLMGPERDQDLFAEKFAHVLEHVGGYSNEQAMGIAGHLLPDILGYDYSSPDGYPNGRRLTDDVINMGLAVMTNGALLPDGLGPHADLIADFPYMGVPHKALAGAAVR